MCVSSLACHVVERMGGIDLMDVSNLEHGAGVLIPVACFMVECMFGWVLTFVLA